ncbi:plastocyanin/azurin family copper-binding protein [Streptomyces sp. NPDC020681]|uniref:cupredoxin domain-containing protein n=1 Tax=Streptomyces sp. NPDC020681 TaxID=3365083 RepID=UPI00379D4736
MPRLTARIPRVLLAALLFASTLTFLDAPAAHSAASHQVVMSGYAFGPRTLTITAGDTVTWINRDSAPHDVKTTSGPESVQSPMLNKGGTWSHTFTVPGSYGYVCTVHPGMTGQLVVKAAATRKPAPAPPAPAPPTHQHRHSVPVTTPSPRIPASAVPSAHQHAGESAAAAPAAGSATPSTAQTAVPAGPAQPTIAAGNAGSARPLDPLLVLAGSIAGVAVLCLLLVGSRSAAASPAGGNREDTS